MMSLTRHLHMQDEDLFVIDNSNKNFLQIFCNCLMDATTLLFCPSGMRWWVRVWHMVLTVGMLCPFAFFPHPFAFTNLAGLMFFSVLNGREVCRVRGMNKALGWPRLIAWIPVYVINALSLSTDFIDDQQLTWDNAETTYEQARFIAICVNTGVLGIGSLFDLNDTIRFFVFHNRGVDRSFWTVNQLLGDDALNKEDMDEEEHKDLEQAPQEQAPSSSGHYSAGKSDESLECDNAEIDEGYETNSELEVEA